MRKPGSGYVGPNQILTDFRKHFANFKTKVLKVLIKSSLKLNIDKPFLGQHEKKLRHPEEWTMPLFLS